MKKVLVLSGAGLSAESGIPTFRDGNGLWETYRVEDVATQNGWHRDKELVLEFYQERFNQYKSCRPNEAHKSFAKLESKYEVYHLTQNIDDLLEEAGCSNINHVHGLITKKKCEWHKNIVNCSEGTRFQCDYMESETEPPVVGDFCPKCGGQMRPDIVWFGEAVENFMPKIMELCKEIKYNDGIFICVGTSLNVMPAAGVVPLFTQVKNKYIVDLNPPQIGNYTLLKGKAGEIIPELVEQLLQSS